MTKEVLLPLKFKQKRNKPSIVYNRGLLCTNKDFLLSANQRS